jgi:hypothetical protein
MMTIGELQDQLAKFPRDYEIFFSSGEPGLTFFRLKQRGDKLVQMDFDERSGKMKKANGMWMTLTILSLQIHTASLPASNPLLSTLNWDRALSPLHCSLPLLLLAESLLCRFAGCCDQCCPLLFGFSFPIMKGERINEG